MKKPFLEFASPSTLDESLVTAISSLLAEAIQARGQANLAVSGGRTPVGLFRLLAEQTLDWNKVNITLADERWVSPQSRDSNEKILRETLLQSHAASANFISLKQGSEADRAQLDRIEAQLREAHAFPFDVLTLGMGEDGHTASLFPCSEEIYTAMSPDNPCLLTHIVPKTAPYDRVTFTLPALMQSKKIFLHLIGANKQKVLAQAEAGNNEMEMPIRAFLLNSALDMEIYWAPR